MATVISATEAARSLGECLARIKHRGEIFILSKNDKPVATLGPVAPTHRITLREFWTTWRASGSDPSFADDLEAVNRADQLPGNPWA
jgi:antitoxin (DNA-binding transcriptional repressor) of toxin-antitoxin stability system